MSDCKWCGKAAEGNAGDYYHEMACWRRDVIRRINEAEENGEDERLPALERELFRASYTGD